MTSRKGQQKYWVNEMMSYHYVSAKDFAEAFKSFHAGKSIQCELGTQFDKANSHPAILTRSKYGTNEIELMKACLLREIILMKRNASLLISKIAQVSSI